MFSDGFDELVDRFDRLLEVTDIEDILANGGDITVSEALALLVLHGCIAVPEIMPLH